MSYNIGQYRSSSNSGDYYTSIISDSEKGLIEEFLESDSVALDDDIIFLNICKTLNIALEKNKSYYLKFTVQRQEDFSQNFYLKLKNENDNNSQQFIDEFTVLSGVSGSKQTFEIIFSPNDNIYNQIVWELRRTILDYQTTLKQNYGGRVMRIQLDEFAELSDIFKVNNIIATKIGIQGPPLLLMSINKEQIRLGRSGIYEINNGIKINSIGFVPHDNDSFILDYEYEEN